MNCTNAQVCVVTTSYFMLEILSTRLFWGTQEFAQAESTKGPASCDPHYVTVHNEVCQLTAHVIEG